MSANTAFFAKRARPTPTSGHAHVESCIMMESWPFPLPLHKETPQAKTKGLLFTNHLLVGRELFTWTRKAHLHFVRLLHLFQSCKMKHRCTREKCGLGNLFATLSNCGMVHTMKCRLVHIQLYTKVGIWDGAMHVLGWLHLWVDFVYRWYRPGAIGYFTYSASNSVQHNQNKLPKPAVLPYCWKRLENNILFVPLIHTSRCYVFPSLTKKGEFTRLSNTGDFTLCFATVEKSATCGRWWSTSFFKKIWWPDLPMSFVLGHNQNPHRSPNEKGLLRTFDIPQILPTQMKLSIYPHPKKKTSNLVV